MTWLKREIASIEEACELNDSLRGEIASTLVGGGLLGALCCASIYLSFAL